MMLEQHLDPSLVKALKLVTRTPDQINNQLIDLEYLARAQERITEHNLKLAEGFLHDNSKVKASY